MYLDKRAWFKPETLSVFYHKAEGRYYVTARNQNDGFIYSKSYRTKTGATRLYNKLRN